MAKKKKKKAAKRKVGKAVSGAASTCTAQELQDAFVCTIIGEAAAGFCEVYSYIPTTPVQEFAVNVFSGATAPSASDVDQPDPLTLLREYFASKDSYDMPSLRVVGRILDVLLNHRGRKACTGGDVFYVLLKETPSQSGCDPKDYKLASPTRYGRLYDITRPPGRKTVDNRLEKLRKDKWADHKKGYVLTPKGKLLFDGWPDLSEIPGLSLTLPPRPTP
jgi:hypothetical protein